MAKKYLIYAWVILLLIFINFFQSCQSEKTSERNRKSAGPGNQTTSMKTDWVGREACRPCHQREYQLWKNSDHDLAMQVAADSTVLGDFNNASFTWYGITTRFYKTDGDFFVHTEGGDGQHHDYKISYTFGIRPLQQYLVEFPDGRLQTLPFCWDTRLEEDGGQRWYHIYQEERITPDDILFWTGTNQNWNFMCAECHSTNVKKNYEYESDTFKTTFSEIDVSCEMCHGPGREHVDWAEKQKHDKRISVEGDLGLKVRLKDLSGGTWVFNDMQKGTAERTVESSARNQIETCALCHSRRSQLTDKYTHGRPILDTHRLPFLDENLYFPDGQILEEVYVYHSFLQSKMFTKGVVCNDCHEPHSTKVYSNDNSLCFRCHLPQKYDATAHHFHKKEGTGASCRDCHMPERTYMVVDPRRDHSIRVPRPDLSEKLGTPNACIQCHKDKNNTWATEYVVKWYGKSFLERAHYGQVFDAARRADPGSLQHLVNIIDDPSQTNMVRSTALSLLRNFPDRTFDDKTQKYLYDKDPLIRLAALTALENHDASIRLSFVKNLLKDPVKSVRIHAAYLLSDIPPQSLTAFDRSALDQALSEYIEVQKFNSDRPTALINLGVVYSRQGNLKEAEEYYKRAISLEPGFVYAAINLADLYRQMRRDDLGESLLAETIAKNPANADLYYSYGLVLTRLKRRSEALAALKKAVELEPANLQMQYYWALAVLQTGNADTAIRILEEALKGDEKNVEVLYALTTICRDRGDMRLALRYGKKLVGADPENQVYQQLLREVQSKAKQ